MVKSRDNVVDEWNADNGDNLRTFLKRTEFTEYSQHSPFHPVRLYSQSSGGLGHIERPDSDSNFFPVTLVPAKVSSRTLNYISQNRGMGSLLAVQTQRP